MNVVFSNDSQPEIIEAMCRWAGPLIGCSYDPRHTTGISFIGENGAGTVLYTDYDRGLNVRVHAAGTGNWLTRQTLALIFGYPFQNLKVKRMTALVARKNKPSRTLCEKLGFVLEGRLRHACENGDHLIVYGMLARECKWLRPEHDRRAA